MKGVISIDTLLQNGTHCLNSLGQPQTIYDSQLLAQQAMLCLCIPLGNFPYFPKLGSRLHSLYPSATLQQDALNCVCEALLPLKNVSIHDVYCQFNDSDSLSISVDLEIQNISYLLEVSV